MEIILKVIMQIFLYVNTDLWKRWTNVSLVFLIKILHFIINLF